MAGNSLLAIGSSHLVFFQLVWSLRGHHVDEQGGVSGGPGGAMIAVLPAYPARDRQYPTG